MNNIAPSLHFTFLTAAAALLVLLFRAVPAFEGQLAVVSFGALHALAIVAALRQSSSLAARAVFVCLAGVLSFSAELVGLLAAQFVPRWFAYPVAFPITLGLASAFGALSYGLLIKVFWVRPLSLLALASIAACCVAATCIAFGVAERIELGGIEVPTIMWWYAFSCAFVLSTRTNERPVT